MRAEKEGGKQTQSRTKSLHRSTHMFLITWGSWEHCSSHSGSWHTHRWSCRIVHSQRQPGMDILDAQGQSVSFMPQQQENQTHTFILEFSTFQITLTRKKKKKGGGISKYTHKNWTRVYLLRVGVRVGSDGLGVFTLYFFIKSVRVISSFLLPFVLSIFSLRNDLLP